MEHLLNLSETALALGCSPSHVRALVQRGELTPIRLGRLVRFDPRALRQFAEDGGTAPRDRELVAA